MSDVPYGEAVAVVHNFDNAVLAAQEALEAAQDVTRKVAALTVARSVFFATGQVLLDKPAAQPLYGQFVTLDEYYEFLARVGRKPDRDVLEEDQTTRRTAEVLKDLHTPGTIAYLFTDNREHLHAGNALAIGKTVGAPRPRLMRHSIWGDENDLVLMVQTTAANGDSIESEVGIDDIALRFDRRVTPGTATPLIAVGAPVVRALVERHYDERGYPSPRAQDAFIALTESGLQLHELGLTEENTAERRLTVEESLQRVVGGEQRYAFEAVKLSALCGGPREALRFLEDTLGGKGAYDVDSFLGRDRNILLHSRAQAAIEGTVAQ